VAKEREVDGQPPVIGIESRNQAGKRPAKEIDLGERPAGKIGQHIVCTLAGRWREK
jgi:hypothetical protein